MASRIRCNSCNAPIVLFHDTWERVLGDGTILVALVCSSCHGIYPVTVRNKKFDEDTKELAAMNYRFMVEDLSALQATTLNGQIVTLRRAIKDQTNRNIAFYRAEFNRMPQLLKEKSIQIRKPQKAGETSGNK